VAGDHREADAAPTFDIAKFLVGGWRAAAERRPKEGETLVIRGAAAATFNPRQP
jgi:hypothetical protein